MLNGTQTQSARVYNLASEVPALRALGVDVLRLSPQSEHMHEIIAAFDDARRPQPSGGIDPVQRMQAFMPGAPCNGYWMGRPGLEQVPSTARPATPSATVTATV